MGAIYQDDEMPQAASLLASGFLPKTQSAKGRNRTDDTSIFSAVLYQLSYLGMGFYGHNYIMVSRIRQ